MKCFVIYLLMVVMCFPVLAWPQSQAAYGTEAQEKKLLEGEQATKAKSEVQKRGKGEKARVKVRLRNKTEVKGYISKMDENSFEVTDKKSGKVTTIAYADVEKVKIPGLSTGAKIAIGVGIGAGVVLGILAILISRIND